MKKNSRTSLVWNYYEKLDGEARCLQCNNTIASFRNTSNLVKHLRRKHKNIKLKLNNSQRLLRLKKAGEDSHSTDTDESETEGVVAEDEQVETVAETNAAVHTIQAYRDVNGTTFLYLQAPDGESGVQIQNSQFHPVVATTETVTSNGEIVSVAVQKEPSALEGQEETHQKTLEETPIKIVHAPVKNIQGSSVANRTVVRQLARPTPIKTTTAASSYNSFNNNNSSSSSNKNKEDSYEAFGRYIASMLRNLPSKNACKVQGEIVNWILKETMKAAES